MSGITPDILAKLQAPFPVEAHELRDGGRDGKLVYLTEEPLIDRLTEIDPNWEFHIISTVITDYNLTRPDSATTTAELTICGITRGGVGCGVANVKEYEYVNGSRRKLEVPIIMALSETEIKGAATDALKRCARQFGVGGYLLRTKGEKFQNEQDFARWYNREFGKPQSPAEPHQTAKTPPKTDDPKTARKSTPRPAQTAPSGIETLDDVVILNSKNWGSVCARLVENQLADKSVQAFKRLKIIAAAELDGFNDKQPWVAIDAANWTEADVIAKFQARIADKQANA